MTPDPLPTDRAAAEGRGAPAAESRRRFVEPTDPHILYPAIAIVALVAIWASTLFVIQVERRAAERAAAGLTHSLTDTYEALVVRSLDEIDGTLKAVKYAFEIRGTPDVLQDLKARGLLPPALVFTISIADHKGQVVASTSPVAENSIADRPFFQSQRLEDVITFSRPRQSPVSGQWELQFSRRLDRPDGSFAGIVMLSVDAAYFVSSYEAEKMGEHGLLAVLNTDGVFLARRSGESVSAGQRTEYAAVLMTANDSLANEAALSIDALDGMPRFTMAHTIYSYPLIVMVGLSADEQLAAVRQSARAYLSWATAGSILVVLVIASLARMSLQLASSRARVVEARLATAAHDEYLAYHDSLTGLPNRSLFTRLLEQSIHQARRYNRQLAVLFLDLDGFKRVNDTLGHESGDQLLQEVAARLKGCLRDSDAVARIGGDEFVVLLPELDQDLYAERVAQKLLSAVARPFLLRGDEFRVTASVGISTYPQDGVDEETLTQNADTAMYQAKDEGKNNVQFFSETLKARSLEQLTLESGLRHALENREFRLDYQARQENGSSRITGVEALLRWQHPDLGTVAPMQFIPIAEDTRLIVPIGKWVLRAACRQNVAWQQQGLAHLTMAVNLTPQQFYDQHLLADVAEILAETGMDSNLLELELSESLVMRDMAKNLPILTGLKDMGIRIAIDDFGVGYLSLARLKQIPLDTIKIDRTYIRDIVEMDENKDLATAIVAIGRALGLTVVAQGVETKDQADFLRQNVCGELQGFYLNRPLPADQVAELLRRQPGDTEPVG